MPVVNCLQKKIPLKDWHPVLLDLQPILCCELLTKKNTFEGLTPKDITMKPWDELWIAYKKKYLWRIDTTGPRGLEGPKVVNCLQKKIPLKDWHL